MPKPRYEKAVGDDTDLVLATRFVDVYVERYTDTNQAALSAKPEKESKFFVVDRDEERVVGTFSTDKNDPITHERAERDADQFARGYSYARQIHD